MANLATATQDVNRLNELVHFFNKIMLGDDGDYATIDSEIRPTLATLTANYLLGMNTYATLLEGLEATNEGGFFQVISPIEEEYTILYQNFEGTAVEHKRYPSAAVASIIADAAAQIAVDVQAAQDAADQAISASQASGDVQFFNTKALANAATLAEGDVVEVFADETRDGAVTRYRYESGALVFKFNVGMGTVTAGGETKTQAEWAQEILNKLDADSDASALTVDSSTGTQTIPEALDQRVINVADLSAAQGLTGLSGESTVRIATGGRSGDFEVMLGDRSAEVAADPQSGIWIPINGDPTGASGALMRRFNLWAGVSVGWFGAVEDGVADETLAIQSGINTGYKTNLGPHTYNHDTLFVDTLSSLAGAGKQSTILTCLSTVRAIAPRDDSSDTNRVSLEGFTMQPATTCAVGLDASWFKIASIRDVYFLGFDTGASHEFGGVTSSIYNVYDNCEFRGASVAGVNLRGISNNSNGFINCRWAACGIGLDIYGSNQNYVTGGKFENCGLGFSIDGVALGGTYANTIMQTRFENNDAVGTIGVNGTQTVVVGIYSSGNINNQITDNGTRSVIIGTTPSDEPSLKADRGIMVPEVTAYGPILTLSGDNIDAGGVTRTTPGFFEPLTDNAVDLGRPSLRWEEVHAGIGTINTTSDEREKQDIGAIPDAWLDAWGEVEWCKYKAIHQVDKSGDDAVWHIGLIAQKVVEVFALHGLDALSTGIVSHHTWDGGDRYSIRYGEADAMEAAWVRRELKRLAN